MKINLNFTFVDYFKEPFYRRIFYPVTVGEYLSKNANPNSPFANKIYEYELINKKTKVKSLNWYSRKKLLSYSFNYLSLFF